MDPRHAFLACVALLSSAIGFACASSEETTVCDQAIDKYNQCQFEVDGGENINCSGSLECASKCAIPASCDEMKLAQPDSGYQSCLNACK